MDIPPTTGKAFSRKLAVTPLSASEARNLVDEVDSQLDDETRAKVKLLVSELVTNSLKHANLAEDGIILLSLEMRPSMIRGAVTNRGKVFQIPDIKPTSHMESGWGLYLLRLVSDRWGIEGKDDTCVWFEIDI